MTKTDIIAAKIIMPYAQALYDIKNPTLHQAIGSGIDTLETICTFQSVHHIFHQHHANLSQAWELLGLCHSMLLEIATMLHEQQHLYAICQLPNAWRKLDYAHKGITPIYIHSAFALKTNLQAHIEHFIQTRFASKKFIFFYILSLHTEGGIIIDGGHEIYMNYSLAAFLGRMRYIFGIRDNKESLI